MINELKYRFSVSDVSAI